MLGAYMEVILVNNMNIFAPPPFSLKLRFLCYYGCLEEHKTGKNFSFFNSKLDILPGNFPAGSVGG